MDERLLGAGLGVLAVALPGTAAAQSPPSCAPERVASVTLRTENDDGGSAIVASHQADVIAEIATNDPTHATRPNSWGYDIQVRQAGRLLARVRRAGRCRTEHRSYELFDLCKLSRTSTLLR